MKHATAWLMALALTLPQISTAEGTDMTDEEKNVLTTVHTMTEAFQAGDIAAVLDTYEHAATVVFEPAAPVSDPALLEQMFTGMASLTPAFAYEAGHEVIVNGDIAIHIAPWSMAARTPEGEEINETGLSIAVLRRQTDGAWKMVIDNPHGSRLLASAQ